MKKEHRRLTLKKVILCIWNSAIKRFVDARKYLLSPVINNLEVLLTFEPEDTDPEPFAHLN